MKRIYVIVAVAAATCLIVGALVPILIFTVFSTDKSTVTTPAGTRISGAHTVTDSGIDIYTYYNIPYAAPPIGQKRFQPPQAINLTSHDGSVDQTIICIQGDSGDGTEDCLVLTVRSTDLEASKPVIAWIHGGGLTSGYSSGPGYSFDNSVTEAMDAVTVNINYRLGYLGFFCIKELWVDGVNCNNGIRDMAAALEWIQENIASFGGDPNRVTVIGQSGGATAILGLVSSPLANNKFHRAVALSPAPEMRFNTTKGDAFQRFAIEELGCGDKSSEDTQQCLLDLPADVFSLKNINSTRGFAYFEFPMKYTEIEEIVGLLMIDPIVVTQTTDNLVTASYTPDSPVTLVISNTAQDNTAMVSGKLMQTKIADFATLNATLTESFGKITNTSNILDIVYSLYYHPNITAQYIYDNVVTDMRATCPINRISLAMAKSSHHKIHRLYVSNRMLENPIYPAFHGWDIFAFFGFVETFVPSERNTAFTLTLQSMVKKLAWEGVVSWSTVPATMEYGNEDSIVHDLSEMPHKEACNKLAELDLAKYGWQN